MCHKVRHKLPILLQKPPEFQSPAGFPKQLQLVHRQSQGEAWGDVLQMGPGGVEKVSAFWSSYVWISVVDD